MDARSHPRPGIPNRYLPVLHYPLVTMFLGHPTTGKRHLPQKPLPFIILCILFFTMANEQPGYGGPSPFHTGQRQTIPKRPLEDDEDLSSRAAKQQKAAVDVPGTEATVDPTWLEFDPWNRAELQGLADDLDDLEPSPSAGPSFNPSQRDRASTGTTVLPKLPSTMPPGQSPHWTEDYSMTQPRNRPRPPSPAPMSPKQQWKTYSLDALQKGATALATGSTPLASERVPITNDESALPQQEAPKSATPLPSIMSASGPMPWGERWGAETLSLRTPEASYIRNPAGVPPTRPEAFHVPSPAGMPPTRPEAFTTPPGLPARAPSVHPIRHNAKYRFHVPPYAPAPPPYIPMAAPAPMPPNWAHGYPVQTMYMPAPPHQITGYYRGPTSAPPPNPLYQPATGRTGLSTRRQQRIQPVSRDEDSPSFRVPSSLIPETARTTSPNLIVDVADTCQAMFPFMEVAVRHKTTVEQVAHVFTSIIKIPLLRSTSDRRRAGKLGINRVKEVTQTKLDMQKLAGNANARSFTHEEIAAYMGPEEPGENPSG